MRFLSDLQNSDKNGAENGAHKYLDDEVCKSKCDEHAESRLGNAAKLSYRLGVGHKEYCASEKEDSRIDKRAGERREDRGEEAELFIEKLIYKSGNKSRCSSFKKNGDNRSRDAECEEKCSAARYKYYDAENESEPRADSGSAETRADRYRNKSYSGLKGSEKFSVCSKKLKNYYECRHHRSQNKLICTAVLC